MEKTNKIIAGIAIASLVGLGVSVAHDTFEPVEVVNQTVTEYVNVTETVEVEVIKEVPVNVTVTEEVFFEDEAFKQLACDRLMFDDVSECVEEVEAENVALELAVDEIEAEFADFLDDEDVVRKDEDVRIIEIKSDFEDVNVVKSDFDRDKYVFEIDVKYDDERKDKKFTKTVTVEVEDGEVEIKEVA